jgi:hypothetical protein
MDFVDLKILSYKTTLLVALASAKHVGDLHALYLDDTARVAKYI